MGRPPGSINRSSARASVTCQLRGYSSIDAMIDAAEIALQKFIEHSEKENNGSISLMESQAHHYLETYVKIAATISKFIHPTLAAIKVSQQDPLKDMSPTQRLEAMKHAVAMLELKVKDSSGSGSS